MFSVKPNRRFILLGVFFCLAVIVVFAHEGASQRKLGGGTPTPPEGKGRFAARDCLVNLY